MSSIRRALISVSDKTGIEDLARELHRSGVGILSTGGTATMLRKAGLPVRDVSDYTGFPEIMDGRVKTLHPRVHGGLLGRRGTDDAVMLEHGIEPIDLLVVNLYPFAATIARPGCTYDDAVENIDIGGPAMLRAAAKNHAHVAVLVDPADYRPVLDELARDGGLCFATRQRLAARAYAHTAAYDAMVAEYLVPPIPGRWRCATRRSSTCAMARTRTSPPPSTPIRPLPRPASPRRGSSRARSCPSTTSPTRTPRSSACGSSSSPPA